ncbi:MAG: hypothetical protein A2Z44_04200 [Betaproteobacteria bacterium RBG_19FT_COMBO_58_11]|nr:MAG: hypothetical protein A2Z44_04200 [Betaproteobacteria bacterium RBG_19FT_COMBO_58_11]
MQNTRPHQSTPEPAAQSRAAGLPNALSSEMLFRGSRALVIEHDGDRYVLQITRNRKLILTK